MAESKSMIDVAYEIMSCKKRAVSFVKLWEEVSKKTKQSNDMMSQFYSDLTLDGRFVSLKDNKWDLKNRRKFAESQIDISKFDLDDDVNEIYGEDGNLKDPEDL